MGIDFGTICWWICLGVIGGTIAGLLDRHRLARTLKKIQVQRAALAAEQEFLDSMRESLNLHIKTPGSRLSSFELLREIERLKPAGVSTESILLLLLRTQRWREGKSDE